LKKNKKKTLFDKFFLKLKQETHEQSEPPQIAPETNSAEINCAYSKYEPGHINVKILMRHKSNYIHFVK
jgi:hypothetical protein